MGSTPFILAQAAEVRDFSITFLQLCLVLAAAGAAGGFVQGLTSPARFLLRLPRLVLRRGDATTYWPRALAGVEFGFFGHVLVGAVAGFAVVILARLFSVSFDESVLETGAYIDTNQILLLIALSLLAGYTGQPLLLALSGNLLSKAAPPKPGEPEPSSTTP